MCNHKNLVKEEPSFDGMKMSFEAHREKHPEYILYSPYICVDCGKRIIILHAIAEDVKICQDQEKA